MRKVFLDDLPRRNGKNNQIDWKKVAGFYVPFIYDNFKGEIEILNYYKNDNNDGCINIRYNNNCLSILPDSFSKCRIGGLLGTHTKQYKYNIGEIIKTKTGEIEILEQIRINKYGKYTQKFYKYLCLVDGNIDELSEYCLNNNVGCNVCHGKKVLKGYNDIATTHPELIKYFVDIEDAYNFTYGTENKIKLKCPDCGYEKEMYISSLIKVGFGCPRCGDKVSYPNKFIRNFLDQLNEEYLPEYSPDWAYIKHDNQKINGNKIYDIYLPNKNEIWEIHGIQHYEINGFTLCGGRTLKEEQENDKIKEELAIYNGITNYIIIDARYSDMEYIKNSLLSISETKRYDLSNIKWEKCHEFACSSLVKTACDLWNSGIKSTLEISQLMKLNRTTIIKYLKQGSKLLGWCDYDSKEEMKNSGSNNGGYNKRKIIQVSLNGEFIKKWDSIIDAQNNTKIKGIHRCCQRKSKSSGGFIWYYEEDYVNINDNIIIYKNNTGVSSRKQTIQLTLDNIFIKEWNSVSEASKNLNINSSSISACCRGDKKYSHAGKFKWMYKEDYDEYIKQQNKSV